MIRSENDQFLSLALTENDPDWLNILLQSNGNSADFADLAVIRARTAEVRFYTSVAQRCRRKFQLW